MLPTVIQGSEDDMNRAPAQQAMEEPGAKPLQTEATASEPSCEEAWQTAEQRAVLYLKRLRVQPRKALECALKALQRAEQIQGPDPVAATMTALRSVLEEEGIFRSRPDELLLPKGGTVPGVHAAPAVSRGIMVPAALDRRPWVTYLERCLNGLKSLVGRPTVGREGDVP